MIIQFDFNNYLKNPIACYCLEHTKKTSGQSVNILTLEDCLPDINKLKHSKSSLDKNKWSFVGDQLRLYYSLQYDDLLYLDSDVYINDFSKIYKYKNCTEITSHKYLGKIINNGTFFHSDKDCDFNRYYFDLYQNTDVGELVNYSVFNKYPFKLSENKSGDMNLISVDSKHFLISTLYYFKKDVKDTDTVYYTYGDIPNDFQGIVFKLNEGPDYIRYSRFKKREIVYFPLPDFLDKNEMLLLFKEQMNYMFNKELTFIER